MLIMYLSTGEAWRYAGTTYRLVASRRGIVRPACGILRGLAPIARRYFL